MEDTSNVCYTPFELVEALCQNTVRFVRTNNVRVQLVVEPCAGDGRLGSTMQKNLPENPSLIAFDIRPRGQGVRQGNANNQKFVSDLISPFLENQSTIALVLNPPFKPGKEMRQMITMLCEMCRPAICAFVLPGKYADYKRLDTLLQRYYHIQECVLKHNVAFERPLSGDFARELSVCLVVAALRPYPRPNSLVFASSPLRFVYVSASDDWHQAFKCGGLRRPVTVLTHPSISRQEPSDSFFKNGTVYFVRYLYMLNEKTLRNCCYGVAARTLDVSGPTGDRKKMTMFPRVWTAGRFYVPQVVLTDWLNHVLREDEEFLMESQSKWAFLQHAATNEEAFELSTAQCRVGAFLDDLLVKSGGCLVISESLRKLALLPLAKLEAPPTKLMDEEDDDYDHLDPFIHWVSPPPNVVDPKYKWIHKLCEICVAREKSGFLQYSALKTHMIDHVGGASDPWKRILCACDRLRYACSPESASEEHEKIAQSALEFLKIDSSGYSCNAPSIMRFAALLLLGREMQILRYMFSGSWNAFAAKWEDLWYKRNVQIKSDIRRLIRLHELVLEHSRLILAFDRYELLHKKTLHHAIKEFKLDFGPIAPSEQIASGKKAQCSLLKVISLKFCLQLVLDKRKSEKRHKVAIEGEK